MPRRRQGTSSLDLAKVPASGTTPPVCADWIAWIPPRAADRPPTTATRGPASHHLPPATGLSCEPERQGMEYGESETRWLI